MTSEPFFAKRVEDAEPGDVWIETHEGNTHLMYMTESGPQVGPAMSHYGESTMSVARSIRESAEDIRLESNCEAHVHRDANGFFHRCYHKCRSIFTWQFFAGLTLSFPIEHALWTKVTPFVQIAEFLGLGINHH